MPADPTTGSGRKPINKAAGMFNRVGFALGQHLPTRLSQAKAVRRNSMRQLRRVGGR